MAEFLAQRWRRQPQGPVTLADEWRAKVIGCILGGCENEIASGRKLSANGAVTRVTNAAGQAFRADGGNERMAQTAVRVFQTEATILWLGRMLGAPSADTVLAGIVYDGTSPVAPYANVYLTRNAGAVTENVAVQWSDPTTLRTLSPSSGSVTNNFSGVIWARVKNGAQNIYRNNVLIGSASNSLSSFGATATSELCVGMPWSIGRNPNAETNLAVMFGTYLSDAEGLALVDNAWQLFRPRRATLYSLPSAGVSFKAAWARNSNIILQPGVL